MDTECVHLKKYALYYLLSPLYVKNSGVRGAAEVAEQVNSKGYFCVIAGRRFLLGGFVSCTDYL